MPEDKKTPNLYQQSGSPEGAATPKKRPTLSGKQPDPDRKRMAVFFLIPLIFFILLQLLLPHMEVKQISYSEFYSLVAENQTTGNIISCEMADNVIRGK